MDGFALVMALLMGLMAVLCVNSGYTSEYARREKYALNGVLRPMDLPKVPASAAVIARDRHRERRGLLGSTVLTGAAVILLLPAGAPTIQTLFFVLFAAAFVGRGVVVAVLTTRDASNQPSTGTPVSDRGARALREWTPIWPWAAVTVLQAAFLLAYVPTSLTLHPEMNPWVLGLGAASVVLTAAGWAFAARLATQPQLAADAAELAWSDAYRRRDLLTVLLIGPLVAIGVAVSAFTYGGDGPAGESVGHLPLLAFGYTLAAGLLAFIGQLRTTARSRRTHTQEPAHAER